MLLPYPCHSIPHPAAATATPHPAATNGPSPHHWSVTMVGGLGHCCHMLLPLWQPPLSLLPLSLLAAGAAVIITIIVTAGHCSCHHHCHCCWWLQLPSSSSLSLVAAAATIIVVIGCCHCGHHCIVCCHCGHHCIVSEGRRGMGMMMHHCWHEHGCGQSRQSSTSHTCNCKVRN